MPLSGLPNTQAVQHILDFQPSHVILCNRARAKTARGLLIAQAVLAFIQIISDMAEYQLVDLYRKGDASLRQLYFNDYRQQALLVLSLVLTIITAVFLIMWFRRAYHNLHRIGCPGLSASEGMAAGCWFIPIYNFYAPFQLMKETWNGTVRMTGLVENLTYENTGTGLIPAWWTFWLMRAFMNGIAGAMGSKMSSFDDIHNRDITRITGSLCGMAAAILLIIVIKRLSAFETILHEKQHEAFKILHESKEEQPAGENSQPVSL